MAGRVEPIVEGVVLDTDDSRKQVVVPGEDLRGAVQRNLTPELEGT